MTMEQTVNHQILKFAVQTAIFCRKCGKVMDVDNAVHVDVTVDGKHAGSTVCCGACYDARILSGTLRTGVTLDVIDGRKLGYCPECFGEGGKHRHECACGALLNA